MIATGSGAVGVGTARNYYVPVRVRMLDSEPEEDLGRWDHVAEASLEVPSGLLLVYGPTEWPKVARKDAEPGYCGVLVYYAGMEMTSTRWCSGRRIHTAWSRGCETLGLVLERLRLILAFSHAIYRSVRAGATTQRDCV
jgi:hypothetical protein